MTVVDRGATLSANNAQNHFGYAPFELSITVEPQPITDLDEQPIAVQLVFEDGQQIDMDNNKNRIEFHTHPSTLRLSTNGACNCKVQIDTYSMFHDNRAFKLVFNVSDHATRHIRACETKPFRLVKHRLEIVNEPESTFYKDEGGRSNCLQCKILLKDSQKSTVKNRDIPLTAKLVYEDMTLAQSSRDILEILTQNVELKKGQCSIDFRINEVSKNHNKRAFRVLYECKSTDALYHDISSCVTNKIMVKSKRTKKRPAAGSKGSRGASKRTSAPKKRATRDSKKQPKYESAASESSEGGSLDLLDDADVNTDDAGINEPSMKKRRRNNNNTPPTHNGAAYGKPYDFDPHLLSTLPRSAVHSMARGGELMDTTQYVPPAITGILPSIRPGGLPRIGYEQPPYVGTSKQKLFKHEPHHGGGGGDDDDDDDDGTGTGVGGGAAGVGNGNGGGGGGGVLGNMFAWCQLAGEVMNKLEWTMCGYEYDEATHSIDTTRPLYRCSYCLKYRNVAGWGEHENWCQLKLAIHEYQTKVKSLRNEWNYQLNHTKEPNGGMASFEQQENGSPPPPQVQMTSNGNGNGQRNKENEEKADDTHTHTHPHNHTAMAFPVTSAFGGNAPPFMVTPTASNATYWGGFSSYGFPPPSHQSPNIMTAFNPPGAPPPMPSPSNNAAGHTDNNKKSSSVSATQNHEAETHSSVKNERGENTNANSSVQLPSMLHKVGSVSRVRSQHGYDAFDAQNNFLGAFNDNGDFFDADHIGQYQPTFDSSQMLMRNQSDDYLFYSNIRKDIFGEPQL